jgi:hypothetical protein
LLRNETVSPRSSQGFLNGLDLQVLLAGKILAGDTHGDRRYVTNRVNMFHTSVVMNYHF